MSNFLDFLEIIAGVIAIIGGALLLIFSIAIGIDYLGCRGFHIGTGYETKWWLACYVKVDDKWVPKEQ